jgi:hypothetical protein
MTQTTNLSLGNEPTGVVFPSDPYSPRFIFGIKQNNVGIHFQSASIAPTNLLRGVLVILP